MNLSIIVLNYNFLECTKQTVENLIKLTTVPHEFIFVDNGSIDGTRKYLESMRDKTNAQQVKYVFNDRNLGVAGGKNSGLQVAEGNYLLTIDDDILVPSNYDKLMIESLDKIDTLGTIGVNVEGKNYGVVNINDVAIRLKKWGNIGGGCVCMSRRIFNMVGYLSADTVYGGEDCDLYNRLRLLNLMNGYIVPKGQHLTKSASDSYKAIKAAAHKSTPIEHQKVRVNKYKYKKKTKPIFVECSTPKLDTKKIDEAIKGKPK